MFPQNFGGGEKRLFEVFSRFPDSATVDWYPQYTENYEDYSELKGFNIFPLEDMTRPSDERSIKETLKFCFLLIFKLNFSKYDFIHVGQMPFFHVFALLMKKVFLKALFRKTPHIVIDWWEYWGSYWDSKHGKITALVGRFVEKCIYLFGDEFVVISYKTNNDVQPHTKANLTLIHNGVDLNKIDQAPSLHKNIDVIIFGRVEEWKNPQMGVYVFEEMLKVKPGLSMLIVGNGSYKATLEQYVVNHNLSGSIKFFGFAKDDDEIYGLIKSSKLMMQFSKQEGGGSITLFEANGCGVPVVTSYFENGIDKELVTSDNGFFFEEQNHKNIAMALVDFLDNTEEQEKMKISAREFVAQYDWSIISKEYYELFSKLMS